MKAQRRCRDIALLSLTSALVGCGWLTPYPGLFTVGKWPGYPLCRRLVGLEGMPGGLRKISPPPRCDPRIVPRVASRSTLYAIRPTKFGIGDFIKKCRNPDLFVKWQTYLGSWHVVLLPLTLICSLSTEMLSDCYDSRGGVNVAWIHHTVSFYVSCLSCF